MTHRSRSCYRQLSPRVIIAKENISDSIACLLAEVPALIYYRHFVDKIVKCKRAAVEHKGDHRLARSDHSVDQLILSSDKIKVSTVTEMIKCPSLAGDLFILTDRQDDHVRCARHFNRFRNLLPVVFRFWKLDLILTPATGRCDLTSF